MPSKTDQKMRSAHALALLWRYLSAHTGLLVLAMALSVISNLLALVGPALSGKAIDALGGAGKVDFPMVYRYAGAMALFYIASSLMAYLLSRIMIRLSQKTMYCLRRDLFQRLSHLPVGYFDSHSTGDIVSRMSYDIDTVGASLSTDLLQISTSAITVLGSLLMMLRISPLLVSVFGVTIPISILFTRYRSKKVRPLFSKRSAELGRLNGFSEETLSGLKTIRAYHQEDSFTQRFDERNQQAVDATYVADYYASITGPSVNFINNLSLSMISVLGSLLFLGGRVSLGNLSSFVLYSRKFSGPINELANIVSELQSTFAATERIFFLLEEPMETADRPDAQDLGQVEGRVELDHVSFGYEPGKTILKDLSFSAQPGSLTAIVGPTGAGKTTIINLLMRFYDPDEGSIRLDGRDLRDITRKSLRLAYAMVLQDTWLFTGTVYENIAYGREGATREEVEAAAKAAHIHEFITRLPQGYDTVLSENGVAISKGQKQLLTIARAMLQESSMLILDEATSNVDTRTEQEIQSAMRRLMEGKTCFVIAHRLSTIQNADHILVMRDGQVVEQGDHASLLQAGGFYAQLYNAQFQ